MGRVEAEGGGKAEGRTKAGRKAGRAEGGAKAGRGR